MSVSQANVGTQLYPQYNNIAWTQPGGPGTIVFPQQTNSTIPGFPVPGSSQNDKGQALWPVWGCGHGTNVLRLFKDFDSVTGLSAACVCCAVCSYIQYL